jgi:hypothetical protein
MMNFTFLDDQLFSISAVICCFCLLLSILGGTGKGVYYRSLGILFDNDASERVSWNGEGGDMF